MRKFLAAYSYVIKLTVIIYLAAGSLMSATIIYESLVYALKCLDSYYQQKSSDYLYAPVGALTISLRNCPLKF